MHILPTVAPLLTIKISPRLGSQRILALCAVRGGGQVEKETVYFLQEARLIVLFRFLFPLIIRKYPVYSYNTQDILVR